MKKNGWKVSKIGDVCDLATGGTPSRSKPEYFGGDTKWLVSGDIHQGEIFDCEGRITEAGMKNSNAKILPNNSVMIALNGQGKTRGTVALLRTQATCNQSMVSISPKQPSVLLPEFLYVNLRGRYEEIRRMTSDDDKDRRGLNMGLIRNIEIPIAPISEQKRIVGIIDNAYDAITTAKTNAEKNIQNAGNVFKSQLEAAFNDYGRSQTIPIGEIAEIFDGPHSTPKTVDAGPVFLGISALQDGAVSLAQTRHVTPVDFLRWTRRVKPRPDDIVFSYETRLGQAAIIPPDLECCLGRRMGLIRVDRTKADPRFILYQYISPPFQSFLSQRTIRGATVDRISIKEFPSFRISLPHLVEQRRTADRFDALREETRNLELLYKQKLTALDDLKRSILQYAFNGSL